MCGSILWYSPTNNSCNCLVHFTHCLYGTKELAGSRQLNEASIAGLPKIMPTSRVGLLLYLDCLRGRVLSLVGILAGLHRSSALCNGSLHRLLAAVNCTLDFLG